MGNELVDPTTFDQEANASFIWGVGGWNLTALLLNLNDSYFLYLWCTSFLGGGGKSRITYSNWQGFSWGLGLWHHSPPENL